MFTPQEVSEKVFPKASFGSGGYSMASVDEFLDALTEDYTALFKENVTLKAKLKVLAEKVEEYRSTEEAMRQALLTAQKMAAKLVQDAQVEKEQILSDARAEAQQEIHRLDDERQAAERKLQYAQEKTAEFIRRSEELCKAHSAFLLSLPELDFAPEKPAAAPAAAPKDDVVSSIEQDILSHYTEAEAEKPAPAVTDEPTIKMPPIDGSAIPSDFRLSLDELKFGRNYGGDRGAPLHFIGHLQRNKVKQVVGKAALIQSIGSPELLAEVDRQAEKLGIVQDILLEVNIGGEEAKSGFAPDAVEQAAAQAKTLAHVRVRGLMTIPPADATREENMAYFAKVWELYVDISRKMYDNGLEYLSMGMSGDFADAIRAGANMVRVGSAIFGARDYSK